MIAALAAKIQAPTDESPIYVQATFYPPDRRTRDYDNCGSTLKAYFDGIADALKVNDSRFRPTMPLIAETVKGGCVEVVLS
jgi:crossover junction endodeoxyribonuclease RusA